MCMTTKTITIMKDAYEILKRHKMDGESFSDVIRREIIKEKKLSNFAGAWSHLSNKSIDDMKNDIKKMREKFTKEITERSKNISGKEK
mgnify:CR=1 FL=1